MGVFHNPEPRAFNVSSEAVQPLYRVRFQMKTVWPEYAGDGVNSKDTIDVEIYQHWLERGDGDSKGTNPQTVLSYSEDGTEEEEEHDHDHLTRHEIETVCVKMIRVFAKIRV